jgi:tRNA uridine 5-carbamoylmethylation protein Kti12
MLVLSGVPGSGKVHYAQHLAGQCWRWINHDDSAGGRPVDDDLERL